jgi:hypothetical protein
MPPIRIEWVSCRKAIDTIELEMISVDHVGEDQKRQPEKPERRHEVQTSRGAVQRTLQSIHPSPILPDVRGIAISDPDASCDIRGAWVDAQLATLDAAERRERYGPPDACDHAACDRPGGASTRRTHRQRDSGALDDRLRYPVDPAACR